MDRATRDVYEREAERWVSLRKANHLDLAETLRARSSGPTVDLGCGPGWHAPALAPPVVAIDGVHTMLRIAGERAPGALRIQADLGALPLRRGSLNAAWAHHSYVHVPRNRLPVALADLHGALSVGAPAVIRVFGGDDEGMPFLDDDFPGRFFALWPVERLAEVVTAAGFLVESVDRAVDSRGNEALGVTAVRERTLPDYVAPDMRLLVCGLNPSLRAADAGVGYVTASNRFWPAALAAGIVSRDRNPWHALRHHRVGFTDLVKRATVAAADLSRAEYREGHARLERLCAWLRPAAVAFVGLAGWRAAVDRHAQPGWQPLPVGGRPAYVLPSTSGLNGRTPLDALARHLRTAAAGVST